MIHVELVLGLVHDLLFGAAAAFGFAVMFNVPRIALFGCAVSGGAAVFCRTLVMTGGLSIELATFIGAVAIGFLGVYYNKRTCVPTAVFAITGSIPMAPAVYAYKSIIALVGVSLSATPDMALVAEAIQNLMKTIMILGGIALGISTPCLLFRRFRMVT